MNLTYHYDNLQKHDVTVEEVEEVLCDDLSVTLRKGQSVLIVGATFKGRILEVGINENLFVFHAMDASKFSYSHYKKKNKR